MSAPTTAGAARAGRLVGVVLLIAVGLAACAREHRPALHRVTIRQFRYEPARLAVAVGDTVEWVNRDIVPHTATETTRRWDSGDLPPGGGAGRVVPDRVGGYAYTCAYHPTMSGHLEVTGPLK